MNEFDYGGKPSIYQVDETFRREVYLNGFDDTRLIVKKTKILMITDGAHFTDGASFHLSEVIKAILSDLPLFIQIDITKASYGSYSASGEDINIADFSKHNLSQYDQIWFIAVSRKTANPLSGKEVQAVYDFMQNGGGVFATGDHEDLGASMCGQIPRVRSMRRWWWPGPGPNGEPEAPPQVGSGKHDTLIGGETNGVPQTITPKYYTAPHAHAYLQRKYPHPVLCGPTGVITVLPDHMHEGCIEVPPLNKNIPVNGKDVVEYPKSHGRIVAPEVIATATNHENNAQFGVIGAYDGHKVFEPRSLKNGVGRIIVDATWHHFFNYNVKQFSNGFDNVKTAMANGTQPTAADLVLAEHYRPMRAYFQNIALWLGRNENTNAVNRRSLWYVRWHSNIQMAVLDDSLLNQIDNPFWYYYDLGTKARDALNRVASQCETLQYILSVIAKSPLYPRLYPWNELTEDEQKFDQQGVSMADSEILETLILGGAMHAIANTFKDEMNEKMLDGGEFEDVAHKGAMTALDHLTQSMEEDCRKLGELILGK